MQHGAEYGLLLPLLILLGATVAAAPLARRAGTFGRRRLSCRRGRDRPVRLWIFSRPGGDLECRRAWRRDASLPDRARAETLAIESDAEGDFHWRRVAAFRHDARFDTACDLRPRPRFRGRDGREHRACDVGDLDCAANSRRARRPAIALRPARLRDFALSGYRGGADPRAHPPARALAGQRRRRLLGRRRERPR